MSSGPLDAYHKLLGIPPREQPPHHYRLLGIDLFESDPEVIRGASDQRIMALEQMTTGDYAEVSQKLLAEVFLARRVLLRPEEKRSYDARLREKLDAKAKRTAAAAPQVPEERGTSPRTPSTVTPKPSSAVRAEERPARHEAAVPDGGTAVNERPFPILITLVGSAFLLVLIAAGAGIWMFFSGGKPAGTSTSTATQPAENIPGKPSVEPPDPSGPQEPPDRPAPMLVTRQLDQVQKPVRFSFRVGEPAEVDEEDEAALEELDSDALIFVYRLNQLGNSRHPGVILGVTQDRKLVYVRTVNNGSSASDDSMLNREVLRKSLSDDDVIQLDVHSSAIQVSVNDRCELGPFIVEDLQSEFLPVVPEVSQLMSGSKCLSGIEIEDSQELSQSDVFTNHEETLNLSSAGNGKVSLNLNLTKIEWKRLQVAAKEKVSDAGVTIALNNIPLQFRIHPDGSIYRYSSEQSDSGATDSGAGNKGDRIGQLDNKVNTHSLRLDIHEYACRLYRENEPIGDWFLTEEKDIERCTRVDVLMTSIFSHQLVNAGIEKSRRPVNPVYESRTEIDKEITEPTSIIFRLSQNDWDELYALRMESGTFNLFLKPADQYLHFQLRPDKSIHYSYGVDDTEELDLLGRLEKTDVAREFRLDVYPSALMLFCDEKLIGKEAILAPPGNSFLPAKVEANLPFVKLVNSVRIPAEIENLQFTKAPKFPDTAELIDLPAEYPERFQFRWCPPGIFVMGDAATADRDPSPVRVLLSRGYYMSLDEVTRKQWESVMVECPKINDSRLREKEKIDGSMPVCMVRWDAAMEFCRRLTDRQREQGLLQSGWKYTLPTEAQWEYACRAGTETEFSFGSDPRELKEHGWHITNATDNQIGASWHRVGAFGEGHPWGLHDMHGNLAEWCLDQFDDHLLSGTDPLREEGNETRRVVRGGHWRSRAADCMSHSRGEADANKGTEVIGFRIVIVPDK
ncbi:MAG: formylglycine-generating enzyme family protein [Planctomyces sp.]